MRALFLMSLHSWENRRLTPLRQHFGGAERNSRDGSWFVLFSVGSRLGVSASIPSLRVFPMAFSLLFLGPRSHGVLLHVAPAGRTPRLALADAPALNRARASAFLQELLLVESQQGNKQHV